MTVVHHEGEDLASDDDPPDLKKAPSHDFAAGSDDADTSTDDDLAVGAKSDLAGKDLTFIPVDPSDIRDIQDGTIPTGATARIEGVIVTGVDPKSNFFFVQEPDGDPKFSGIAVYFGTMTPYTKPDVGDIVTVQGSVREFTTKNNPLSRTDLEDITFFENTGSGATLPAAAVIATPADLTAEATAEPYEGVLVKITSPKVLTALDSFNEFTVTGSLAIDDRLFDYSTAPPKVNDTFSFLEGPLDYNNGHYKLLPRSLADMPKGVTPLALVSLTPTTTSTLVGATATFTVTVNQNVTTAATINISSSDNGSAMPAATTATIDVGKNSTKFVVNGIAATTMPVTITAGLTGSTPATVTATLNVNAPAGPAKLSALGPPTITLAGVFTSHNADERTGLVNVTLSAAAPAGGTVLLLESTNTAAVLAPDQVTIPEGQTTGSFRLVAVGSAAGTSMINATDGDTLLTITANVVVTAPAAPSTTTKELVLNEVLYSPPFSNTDTTVGDASCDGVRDSGKDEFVELVNLSAHPVDLNGVSLWDSDSLAGATPRFKFPSYFLGAGESVVVFGGTRTLSGTASTQPWCVTPVAATATTEGDARAFASPSTGLSLGNNGDTVTVTLLDKSKTIDSVTWTDGAAPNESLQRSPEHSSSATWIKHTSFTGHAIDRVITPGSLASGLAFSLANPTP